MRASFLAILFVLAALGSPLAAQSEVGADKPSFEAASSSLQTQLEESLAELARLRTELAAEQIPLAQRLSQLENQLTQARADYQQSTRLLDSRTLDLSNLKNEIEARDEEASYLSSLLGEYVRNFESRLHISELARYREAIQTAKLAGENGNLSAEQVYQAQTALLGVALERLHEAVGGVRFEGRAVDRNGLVKPGTFVLVGPAALFRSSDGSEVGTAEQRLGSVEPAVIPFDDPVDRLAAEQFMAVSGGSFLLDPSLGDAHKIEATSETLLEHIQKGGPVMIPILGLAGAALLVVLYKWLSMAFVRRPSPRGLRALLAAVERRDHQAARREVEELAGPVGAMLSIGVAHIDEPRELVEEVMYEHVLATRLKLQRWLPFVAISASSAPLLGLLGTVTGIMNTFTLITVFGTGDVKTLSSGISEALITTEYGLIVAIPSLLLHGFLSRKAKSVVDQMEKAAIALLNQLGKAQSQSGFAGLAAGPAPLVGEASERATTERATPERVGASK